MLSQMCLEMKVLPWTFTVCLMRSVTVIETKECLVLCGVQPAVPAVKAPK